MSAPAPSATPATLQALFRYPVKGLSPERLSEVTLREGQALPRDRAFAITNGSWAFDPSQYQPRPKGDFLMLRDHPALARLDARLNDVTNTLVVRDRDGSMAQAALHDEDALQRLAGFVGDRCGKPLSGAPRFVSAPDIRFTDAAAHSAVLMNAVSMINLASLRELERVMGVSLDPRRFRANLYFDGAEPWAEHDWLDQVISVGGVQVRPLKRIRRCAAVNVNLDTGERDQGVPQALLKHFGHLDLGVYVEVLSDGVVTLGDSLQGAVES